jgi:hypothetical protein
MQNLSTDDFENVLELIVAFEWLVEMSQSVAITIAEENTYFSA